MTGACIYTDVGVGAGAGAGVGVGVGVGVGMNVNVNVDGYVYASMGPRFYKCIRLTFISPLYFSTAF